MEKAEFKKTVSDWIRSQYASSDESLRRTFRFNDVYGLLEDGVAHFWFRKADGSLRSAYGTLNRAIIERHGGEGCLAMLQGGFNPGSGLRVW